ncbi:MAG: FxsA family protein [Verrucomicrobiales bacterium]|nr:FxsA family protein [Verrucomicrobiales bacterium]
MFFRLLALFISIPVIELFLFLQVGARVGWLPTLAIVVITGILGASLSRAQGLKTLVRYQQALAEGRLPHREVIEGLMILAAGVLLLTPGFLTDAIGFALLVPPVRDAVREKLTTYLSGRIRVVGAGMPTPSAQHPTDPETVRRVYRETGVIEVEAEVVEESPPKG